MAILSKNITQTISKFIQLWKKPYLVFQPKSTRFILSLGVACFVWFMLFCLEIFGMNAFPTFQRFYWSGIYALGCLLIMLVNTFIIQEFVFKKYTIGNTIIWVIWLIQCIGFTNFSIRFWVGLIDFYFYDFLVECVNVLVVSFVISPVAILIHDRYFLEKQLSDIEITYLNVADDDDVLILFKSEEKGREKDFRVMLDRVLYVQSGGNYVEVYYNGGNRIEHKLIRTKLINLEKEPPHSDLVRCHKSYMVNRRNIDSVKSSTIRLKNTTAVLPLSDTYKKNFK